MSAKDAFITIEAEKTSDTASRMRVIDAKPVLEVAARPLTDSALVAVLIY